MPILRERKDGAYYFRVRVQQNMIATFQVSQEGTRALIARQIRPGDMIPQATYREGIQNRWFRTGGSGAGWIQDAPRPSTDATGTNHLPSSDPEPPSRTQAHGSDVHVSTSAASQGSGPAAINVPTNLSSDGHPNVPPPTDTGGERGLDDQGGNSTAQGEPADLEYAAGDEPGWTMLLDSLSGLVRDLDDLRDRSVLMRFASFDDLDDLFWRLYRFSENMRTKVADLEDLVDKEIDRG